MKQVVIIGAGPAGLTAAFELLKNTGYNVIVLEETDRIGGISQTVNCGGNRMDLGGHRFFSKDLQVNAWWQEQMPLQGAPAYDDMILGRDIPVVSGGPDPEKEDRVMLMRSRVSRIFYNHSFFDYPVSLNARTLKAMGISTTMQVGLSFLASSLHKQPNSSLENYYINSFGRKLYSMFFEGYTQKVWGRHPRDIDASWGKQRTKELSIAGIIKDFVSRKHAAGKKAGRSEKDINTSLIESFHYPKYGPGQMWETAADRIRSMGGEIRLRTQVTGFLQDDSRIMSVKVRSETGEYDISADAVFSSMPIKDLIKAMHDVPPDIRRIAEGLPYRDFVIVGLLVDHLCLENETARKTLGNIIPDDWIYVQDTDVKLGRIQIFNNWSPYMVKEPENTVWLGLEYFCSEGDDFWCLPEEECAALAVKELTVMGFIEGEQNVIMSHRERVRKAYPAYFGTYGEIGKVIDFLNGFENLYCIGRNGQHRYNNMDHSMVTAFEAVKCFKNGSANRDAIWNVNTEQKYHE